MTDPQISVGNCCSCGYTGEMCVGRYTTKCPGCWKIMRTCGRCHQGMSRETWGAILFLYSIFVACFFGLYLMYAPHASPARLGTVSAVGGMLGCASAVTIVLYKAKVGRMTIVHEWKRYDVVADEIIDVLEPIEAPFNTRGHHAPQPPPVMITEPARRTMIAAAAQLHPSPRKRRSARPEGRAVNDLRRG